MLQKAIWKIWIDTGGTFTDCIADDPKGQRSRLKVLSKSALRGRILEQISPSTFKVKMNWGTEESIFNGYNFRILGKKHNSLKILHIDFSNLTIKVDHDLSLDLKNVLDFEISAGEEAPILAARIITGTPLNKELPGINMRLGSTIGTNALLERTGAQTSLIVTSGYKDLLLIRDQQRPDIFSLNIPDKDPLYEDVHDIQERMSAKGYCLKKLDQNDIQSLITKLQEKKTESIAISFLHSYLNQDHEEILRDKLKEAGFKYITRSATIAPVINYLNRTETATVNAYLDPKVREYLSKVFKNIPNGDLKVMTSAGGLVDYKHFLPKDSLFSGPAGGIVGAVEVGRRANIPRLISFDMGGTSTDVARYEGKYEYQYETRVGGATIISPSLSIETVASGGGSICSFDGMKFSVGPESAGSEPGPACYGANGPLTITDVNLLLGRLDENNFGIPVNKELAWKAFRSLTGDSLSEHKDPDSILEGFLRIVNEKMATAIRKISINKGYDTSEYSLISFGGAGGQHACDIAEILSINKILVPYDAGLLSAVGMGNARIERFYIKQVLKTYQHIRENLEELIRKSEDIAVELLKEEHILEENIYIREVLLYARFMGQETSLEIIYEDPDRIPQSFRDKYEKIYGHWIENREIEIESIKVIAAEIPEKESVESGQSPAYIPVPLKYQKSWFDNAWVDVPVYIWEDLNVGADIHGPALLISKFTSLVLKKNWDLNINIHNQAVMKFRQIEKETILYNEAQIHFDDSIQIELFTNRFISLAEEMGALLRRSSFSVNIKERLDYSCALLDRDGELIVNAPHIPVHLGGLGLCVRSIIEKFVIKPGQVFITNHPGYGGSHLPDITLVAPIFDHNDVLTGFVANRAHHAELGGSRPGSMPPDATHLPEEGKVIAPFCLVDQEQADWDRISNILTSEPFPTRSIEENIADLTGSLASIQAGSEGLKKLCRLYGTSTIQYYMEYLKDYANQSLLKRLKKFKNRNLKAIERLDDGHKIKVKVSISDKKMIFDFTGSSGTHPGNMNATPAIVRSAVLYVLRLLVDEDIPLNEGLMRSVDIKLPTGFLNPDFYDDVNKCPAVVGGNTETSQRLVDTLLKSFSISACSQGTMNNFLFGNSEFSYYETIGGGVGATDGHRGASAVHQHMTNTRITDPEILEFRYPVRLDRFGIRKNSGGKGLWNGGDGIERIVTFLETLDITILSQHRKEIPYGLKGGEPGKRGQQYLITKNSEKVKLQGIDAKQVEAGDSITILTPGGGGFGRMEL
jgi:5-oxoprolinase (ATP-hydrolysing)